MEIGIVKYGGYQGEGELVKTLGGWTLYNFSGYKDDIAYTLSEQEIKELGANKYYALPIVTCGPFPPYRVTGAAEQFVPPVQLEMDNDNLEFAGAAGSKGSVTFTGRYGAYIHTPEGNYRLAKSINVAELSEAQVREIMAKSEPMSASKRTSRKKSAK